MAARTTDRGTMLAWVRSDCDGNSESLDKPCELHVSDITHGTEQVIPTAVGTDGYVVDGQFSPDGSSLAAAGVVGADGPYHLTMIDLRTATPTVVAGSLLPARSGVVPLGWSIDGTQVFMSAGDHQPAKAYRVGDPAAVALAGPLTASFVALPLMAACPAGRDGSTGPASTATPDSSSASAPTSEPSSSPPASWRSVRRARPPPAVRPTPPPAWC